MGNAAFSAALRGRRLKMASLATLSLVLFSMLIAAGCRIVEPVLPQTDGVDRSQPPEVGDLAPEFQLTNLEGQTISLSELADSPILLVFWQYTCHICHEVMPYIQEIFEENTDEDLEVITISVRGENYVVSQYMQEQNWSFPVLLDNDLAVVEKYRVWGTPTIFFIDRGHIIRDKLAGSTTESEIREKLSEILPEPE